MNDQKNRGFLMNKFTKLPTSPMSSQESNEDLTPFVLTPFVYIKNIYDKER